MSIEDTIWLLAHSSNPEDKREWAVLYWKSQGLKHEEIANKWGYSINWVQRYMTRAYKRFEVPPELNKYEKLQHLEERVFPPMRKFIANEPEIVRELPPPPTAFDPPEDQEQAESSIGVGPFENKSEENKSKEEDQDPPIIEIRTPKTLPPPTPSKWIKIFRRVLFGIFSLLIVTAIAYLAYTSGRRASPMPEVVVVTATFPHATDTLLPSNPTDIPVPTMTSTQVPTNTAIPTAFVPPADGILFQDNFDDGLSSEWNTYDGQWLVSNGTLTLLADDIDSYKWIALRKPEWKNYVLSLTVNIPFQSSAAQSHVAVAVRNEGSQSKYIGVPVDTIRNRAYWAFIEGYSDTAIAGLNEGSEFLSGSNMELEVNNDTYTLRINGREVQKISMTGYSSGGISLGIYCYSELGCPSFDNVKVTYLP
jgi:hypothetical protein